MKEIRVWCCSGSIKVALGGKHWENSRWIKGTGRDSHLWFIFSRWGSAITPQVRYVWGSDGLALFPLRYEKNGDAPDVQEPRKWLVEKEYGAHTCGPDQQTLQVSVECEFHFTEEKVLGHPPLNVPNMKEPDRCELSRKIQKPWDAKNLLELINNKNNKNRLHLLFFVEFFKQLSLPGVKDRCSLALTKKLMTGMETVIENIFRFMWSFTGTKIICNL